MKQPVNFRFEQAALDRWRSEAKRRGLSLTAFLEAAADAALEERVPSGGDSAFQARPRSARPAPVITTPRVVPESIKTPTERQEKPSQAYLDALAGKVSIKKT